MTLVYKTTSTTDEAEIKTIKYGLDDFVDYEVSVEYGDDGYVNKVILEEVITASQHNSEFERYTGSQPKVFLDNVFDHMIALNKRETGRTVTLVYKSTSTTDETKIKSVKNSLDKFGFYEVTLEYDEYGYVNKVILEDI